MKKIVSVLFAILMVAFATIPAFAVESPVATTAPATTFKYEVDVIPTEGGDGSYEYKTDDKLTDPEMDLIITGDIDVTPYYKKSDTSIVETGTVNRDVNKTSPQTGANDVLPYAVIMLSITACGAAVVMLVRTNKSK